MVCRSTLRGAVTLRSVAIGRGNYGVVNEPWYVCREKLVGVGSVRGPPVSRSV